MRTDGEILRRSSSLLRGGENDEQLRNKCGSVGEKMRIDTLEMIKREDKIGSEEIMVLGGVG